MLEVPAVRLGPGVITARDQASTQREDPFDDRAFFARGECSGRRDLGSDAASPSSR